MKKFLKWFGLGSGAVVLLLGAFVVNSIWFKPVFIEVFFERAFLEFGLQSPQSLSSMRLLEGLGIRGHNAKLDDISPERTEWFADMIEKDLEILARYDRGKLSGQKALSYDIMEFFLQQQSGGRDFLWHGYPVNQMGGVQNGFPSFMASIHHIGDRLDCEHYISRLSQTGRYFDQLLEDLRLRESRGIIPPRFAVEKVLDEMNGFIGKPPTENILYTSFAEKSEQLSGIEQAELDKLLQQVQTEIDDTVYPAYRNLIAYFEGLKAKATTNHGVWKLPNGDAYYAQQLFQHTTTRLTADEIHQIGLDEVARISAEMDRILVAQGYTEGTVGERMVALGREEQFLYPNTDEGRQQLIDDFQEIINEIDAGISEMFDLEIKAPVEVRRVPEFREEGSALAYYQGPSQDGSRPGVFFLNLRDTHEHPTWSLRTLAYHEAIPGHHYQTSIQSELSGVPQFRKFLGFTAFSEGWGLYAERLAWEAGYLDDDPFSDLGRLKDEMLRAVRLVVDTGVHQKRWTREQAIDYMVEYTGTRLSDATAEIERYMVWPGQATAYKVGMIKLLELRGKAKAELGEAFDIREFHRAVLQNGDVPLFLLEREIDRYIEDKKTSA
ncbi:MAG: DUF885 domain-containing protein [Gammaproteobacteria bacterium]|nr:DUF885 domain-containing protein [Gammaproteobacteria bacterium]NNM21127.1 DUF885 domain-containing protein [Gammaproteobacteria bacterium]